MHLLPAACKSLRRALLSYCCNVMLTTRCVFFFLGIETVSCSKPLKKIRLVFSKTPSYKTTIETAVILDGAGKHYIILVLSN